MDTIQFQLASNEPNKLTEWKNEPSILVLKQDLEAAKPSQQAQIVNMNRWQNLLSVTGEAKPIKVKGRSSVQPKLIRRQAEWRYAALSEPFLGSEKIFKIDPATFEDEKAARQNSLVLNWQFRTKINRVKFIDDFVRATVDEGTSILRVGWTRYTVPITKIVPVWTHFEIQDEQQAEQLQQALAAKQENIRGFTEQAPPEIIEAVNMFEEQGIPTVAQQTGEQEVASEKVILNHPTVEVLNPRNVYIDPSCQGDISKALFVIVSFETNKAALLKEGNRYTNLDKVDWQGHTILSESDHETSTPSEFNLKDTLRKRVVAFEYWGFYDINGDDVLAPFVGTWIGDVMVRMEENPFPDGKLPFVVVPYSPVKRDLYGEPDAELLEDNQKILGAVTRGMVDLLGKSANSQQGFAMSMLDPLNRRRYDDGKDYEFNPSMTPATGIITHKYPELPQSALMMLNLQNQEAESLSGVKAFSGGLSGDAYGAVATNTRATIDAAAKRETAILRRMAQGMSEVGIKIIAMNQEFLSEEEVIRVTNQEYETVKREDLKGNFDLIVDISTTEVDNAKAQDMGFMVQTIGPTAGQETVMMILAEIAELKRMPALAQKLRTFKPTPTPEQAEIQRLEIEKLRKEVELIDSEIALNMAKAAEAGAKKDKTNLDYVEQETGTAHERDMAKQRGQAEGNQALEVTKAFTKPRKIGEKAPDIESAIGYNAVSDKLKLDNDSTLNL